MQNTVQGPTRRGFLALAVAAGASAGFGGGIGAGLVRPSTTDALDFALSPTRAEIPSRVIPASITAFAASGFRQPGDRGERAKYRAGSAAGPMAIKDAAGRWFELDCSGSVDVGWFGAKGGDAVTDREAFRSAVVSPAARIDIPAGTFYVDSVALPDRKVLCGAGKSATTLIATSACDFVIEGGAGSVVRDLTVNGSRQADKGVSIGGDYASIESVHVQFCKHAFFNFKHDVIGFTNTSEDHNEYGIYSANRFINGFVSNHQSRGGTKYGAYLTYSDQQPQVVRFEGCLFFGNEFAIWSERDIYILTFLNSIIDGCTGTGLRVGPGPNCAGIHIGANSYISAQGICLDIAPGVVHITIRDSDLANARVNIRAQATKTARSTNLVVSGCSIGVASEAGILLDSVDGAMIETSVFAPVGGARDIVVQRTFAGEVPKVAVRRNTFQRRTSVDREWTDLDGNVGLQ